VLVTVVALFALACLAGPAGADPKPPAPGAAAEQRPVLLPVDGDTSIPHLADEIESALGNQGRKVQRSSLKLEDLMLAVGCKTTSVACLQDIGQSVKASGLILARARRKGDGVELSLRWFDVKTGGDLGEAVRLLPREPGAREKILTGQVRDLLGIRATPASQELSGGLSIAASVPYVEILLDGQERGTVPLEFRNLKVGTYTVVARRDGYITWQGRAVVKPDQMTRVEIDMVPAPRSGQRPGYLESIRTHTWITGGVGLLSLAIGAGFAAHMKAQQDHLNGIKGVVPDEIRVMQDYKETGERDALAANILFGVGSAALVAAVVLSYFDYRRTRPTEQSPTDVTVTKGAALRLGPGAVQLRVGF